MVEQDEEGGGLGPADRAMPAVPTRPASGADITTTWGRAVHDALFLPATAPDVRDGWGEQNIAAGQAVRDLARISLDQPPIAGWNGSIVGIVWRRSGAITAGKLSLYAKSGSQVSPVVEMTSTLNTATSGNIFFAAPHITFTAATSIRMAIETTSDFAPATIDLTQCGLVVRYDYRAG